MSVQSLGTAGAAIGPADDTTVCSIAGLVAGLYEVRITTARAGTDDSRNAHMKLTNAAGKVSQLCSLQAVPVAVVLHVVAAASDTFAVKVDGNAGGGSVYAAHLSVRKIPQSNHA